MGRATDLGVQSSGSAVRFDFVRKVSAALFFALLLSASAWSQEPQMAGITPPQGALPCSVSGTVIDRDGAVVTNAKVTITQPGAEARSTNSNDAGYFLFSGVAPGNFEVAVVAAGFATSERTGFVRSGQEYVFPQITMAVATADVNVEVTVPSDQVAEEQAKVEEKQRIFGAIPNYYVTYEPHAAALPARLKFQLAWKTFLDPVSLGITGAIAGVEQATDTYGGYGQGAQGYGKRYGAAYADFVSGVFIGGALLPIVFKQDPRYFWKGTGTNKSRALYAIANAVIRKGDNGRWQPDYSGILGGLASGGISNLYYPAQDRNGAALTFENTAIGIGGSAAGNLIQEFLLPKLTPNRPGKKSSKN